MRSGPGDVSSSAAIDFVAGSLGGIANVIVGQPLDTVKVKMQTFPSLYQNALTCFKQTVSTQGIRRGLYAGTIPAIAANVAENSVLFCSYSACQDLMRSMRRKQESDPMDKALSGMAAGFLTSFVICPTELIKCKLQAMRESTNSSSSVKLSMSSLVREITRTKGLIGLMSGLSVTMAREVPGFFFFFGAYEACKHLITNGQPQEAGLLTTIVSGSAGGVALWSTIYPLDVVKSRIQVHNSASSIMTVFREIIRQEGVRALYRGLGPTLLRTIPSTAALFVVYENSRKIMRDAIH